jgi:hypothetical protein
MGLVGVEPTKSCDRQILSLLRMPVPPQSREFPRLDSNQEKEIQSLPCYRYTTRECLRRESNPHVQRTIDFESIASASSATKANISKNFATVIVHHNSASSSNIQTSYRTELLNIHHIIANVKNFFWNSYLFLTKNH